MKNNYIQEYINTNAGLIPRVSDVLSWKDTLGGVMVRWSINRNNYKIDPGLYAVGSPDENSEVLVTANYKLSFDMLRKNLTGLNVWILVLDTKGINVWCAAGKGTFGTKELVNRINQVSLNKVVTHKRIILPQLGAPGVAAHSVKCASGFSVIYGPVRASDVKVFLQNHHKATKQMRRVYFGFYERFKLIPVDFLYRAPYLAGALMLIFLLSGIDKSGISFQQSVEIGVPAARNIFLSYFAGIVITPLLLPYIPFRSFSMKGFITGLSLFLILLLTGNLGNSMVNIVAWFFLMTVISSFLAMNFTGSSTYTSLSGVKKEMKYAVPLQIIFSGLAAVFFIIKIIF